MPAFSSVLLPGSGNYQKKICDYFGKMFILF